MGIRTKKVGITGKYATRYGQKLRKQVKAIEILQRVRSICPFCGKKSIRRQAAGIWKCRGCHRAIAGGAWEFVTTAATTAKTTINRLKKNLESRKKPEKIYSPLDADNKYLKFGLNQVQGWKKTMEDYAIHFLDKEENKFMNIFGIFDGHGGREVPKYLSSHFLDFLNENKNFVAGKYKDAFSETFFELDKSFTTKEAQEELTKYSEEYKPDKEREIKEINDLCAPNEKLNNEELEQVMAFNEVFDPRNIENANIAEFTGATGIIIAVCYRDILVAHAGNSRCLILDQDGKILNKTKDHTMKDENEKKRVDLARSFNDEEEEKKKGEDEHIEYLDSTRGFGDLEFKGNEWIEQKDQEISVEPDILLVPYDKDNKQAKYIIFGSHGMFEGDDDKVNEEIGKFFIEEINKIGLIKPEIEISL